MKEQLVISKSCFFNHPTTHCTAFAKGTRKLLKTRDSTNGCKFKCRHQGRLRKNSLPLTGRYKSMLANRSPIQVQTAWRAAWLWWSAEPCTDRAATNVGNLRYTLYIKNTHCFWFRSANFFVRIRFWWLESDQDLTLKFNTRTIYFIR